MLLTSGKPNKDGVCFQISNPGVNVLRNSGIRLLGLLSRLSDIKIKFKVGWTFFELKPIDALVNFKFINNESGTIVCETLLERDLSKGHAKADFISITSLHG